VLPASREGQIVLLKQLLLERVLLPRYNLTLVPLFPVRYDSRMACVVELLVPKCRVACYLALGEAAQGISSLVLILGASTIYGAVPTLRPPCSFSGTDEEVGIRKEVVGVLLEVMPIA
jgi:hypothetical protein